MTNQLFVKAGSCMNGGDGRICALQSTDCPVGTSFTSPQMLQQGGGASLAHGGTCATRKGTEEVAKIGSCVPVNDDVGFCASDSSSCAGSQSFVAVDDRCTIRTDGMKENVGNGAAAVTQFGKCMADNTCYWSQQDCSNPNSWQKPHIGVSSSSNDDCSCENVRVGACQDQEADFYYCAVSAEACSTGNQKWIDAPSLLSNSAAPDCFLCRQDQGTPIQGAPTTTTSPTFSPPPPFQNDTPSSVSGVEQNSSQDNKTAVIVGASVGGTAIVLLAVAALFYTQRRIAKGVATTTSKATVSDVPMETIENSSSNHVDDIEELSNDGL